MISHCRSPPDLCHLSFRSNRRPEEKLFATLLHPLRVGLFPIHTCMDVLLTLVHFLQLLPWHPDDSQGIRRSKVGTTDQRLDSRLESERAQRDRLDADLRTRAHGSETRVESLSKGVETPGERREERDFVLNFIVIRPL